MINARDGYDFKDKNVYLSGPMTGFDDWNRAEFNKFAWNLRDMGAGFVFNPAEDAPHGEDPFASTSSPRGRTTATASRSTIASPSCRDGERARAPWTSTTSRGRAA